MNTLRSFLSAGLAVAVLFAAAPQASSAQGYGASDNLVETARAAGSFQTLLAALDAADLTAVLQGDGPFTVFAPTDSAFAALPEGTVESLLQDPDALREILTFHVVPGKVMAEDVSGMDSAETVQGGRLEFSVYGGDVRVNGASVTTANVEASNGVIHVIDQVILPGN